MFDLKTAPLLQVIPTPDSIRLRLAQLVRERSLLKSLLKLSQQKQDALQRDLLQGGAGEPRQPLTAGEAAR